MIEIKAYSYREFEKLKPFWEDLQCGEDMTVFQQYIWYYGLNKQYESGCFKNGEYAEYYVVFKEGKAKLIAPVHIKKHGLEYKGIGIEKGIYMIGQWSFTDYLNFIYNDFDEECVLLLIEGLKKKYPRLPVHFNFMKAGSRFDTFLSQKYADFKISETTCIQTLPKSDFETYFKSLSKHTRQNIRTALNREAKNRVDIYIKVFNTVSQTDADDFFKIYVERSAEKNTVDLKKDGIKNTVFKYSNKVYNDNLKAQLNKFNYLTYSMENNPASCLIGIFNGNKKIGFIYGLTESDGTFRNINVCFDREYGFYTPGITAFYRFFKEYIYRENKKPSVVDMTRGTEPYKYNLGGTEHYLNNYKI